MLKNIKLILATIFLIIAALATPIAIGCGLYDWVGNNVEFKHALWYGFKMWVSMLFVGLVVGYPLLISAGKR